MWDTRPGIGDEVTDDAIRICDGRPHELIRWDCKRHAGSVQVIDDFVDRNHLIIGSSRAGKVSSIKVTTIDLGDTGLETPPSGGITSVRLTVGVTTGLQIEDLYLEDVSGGCVGNKDGSCQDVYPISTSCRTTEWFILLVSVPRVD